MAKFRMDSVLNRRCRKTEGKTSFYGVHKNVRVKREISKPTVCLPNNSLYGPHISYGGTPDVGGMNTNTTFGEQR